MGLNQSYYSERNRISRQTVSDFSSKRYQGLWYVLARYPTYDTKNSIISSTSKYEWDLEKKVMRIHTVYIRDEINGGNYSIDGIAYPTGSGKFQILFKNINSAIPYWVHSTDYTNYSIVGGPNGGVMILGRKKIISYEDKKKLTNRVQNYGYVPKYLKWNYYPQKMNLKKETNDNTNYSKVLNTTRDMQLSVVNLKPDEFVDWEKHNGSQFIMVQSGSALIKTGGEELLIRPGNSIIIPKETLHHISNNENDIDLKFFTLYTPPQHSPDEIISKD